ncbi:hypothetical protein QJR30_01635 [Paraclostridium sordellii]|uniref:hypothetical protein n=1 Tax=Paraclostridium sordellii TaxID=1505 RepID=UPI0030CAF50B
MTYTLKDKALQLLKENKLSESLIGKVDLSCDIALTRSIQTLINQNDIMSFFKIIEENQIKR